MNQKTITGATLVLCILCLALGAYNLYSNLNERDGGQKNKVVLYFGLDLDESDIESGKTLMENAVLDELTKRGFGYTMYWTEGGYATPSGSVFGQDTLVVIITFIDAETGKEIAKAVKEEVGNQLSLDAVLVESYKLKAEITTF